MADTEYYNLKKPSYLVTADIGDMNDNMDIIDDALHGLDTGKFDAANVYNGLDKTAAGFALDARQGKALNDNITNKFGTNYGSTATPVTDLGSLPINGTGIVTLAAALSPTGIMHAFSFIKSGAINGDRYNVLVKRISGSDNEAIYFGSVYDGTFIGWQQLALNANKTNYYFIADKSTSNIATAIKNHYSEVPLGMCAIRIDASARSGFAISNKASNAYGNFYAMDNIGNNYTYANVNNVWTEDAYALNSKIVSYKNDASTISELKTDLLTFVNTLSVNDVRNYSFWTSGTMEAPFSTGQLYAGDITVTSKSSNSLRFSAVFSCDNGTPVSVGYNAGTWKIEALALNGNREYVVLGAGASGVTTSSGYLIRDNANKTVRVYGYARSDSNITTSMSFAGIPSGYRPTSNYSGFCTLTLANGGSVAAACIFGTDGTIKQNMSSSVREIAFFGEYPLA